MERFCFVHAADLHLDTPFEGLRGVAPAVQAALREASLQAFDALVELCLERDAAFLVVAGDVYDGAERGLRAQLRFRQGLERLSEAGVRVFVVHGNHDPTGEGWSAIRSWPEGSVVFGAERVEAAEVVRDGTRLATVHGISYPRRDVTENLSLAFPRAPGIAAPAAPETASDVAAQGGGSGLRVGVLHCNVGGRTEHAPYAACSLDDLRAAAIDYWALGHVHTRQTLCESPWVVYPGNLQGRSPRGSECGPKGAVVVDAEVDERGGRVTGISFEALDPVRFLAVDLDVTPCPDLGEVEVGLQAEADRLRAEHPGRMLILSARLVGRSALRRDLARPEVPDELLESLRDGQRAPGPARSAQAPPPVWWASLSCEVEPLLDREAIRERDDLCGEILGLVDALSGDGGGEDAAALRRFCLEAFSELPESLDNVPLPRLPDNGLLPLLKRAEQTALERVAADEDGVAS